MLKFLFLKQYAQIPVPNSITARLPVVHFKGLVTLTRLKGLKSDLMVEAYLVKFIAQFF